MELSYGQKLSERRRKEVKSPQEILPLKKVVFSIASAGMGSYTEILDTWNLDDLDEYFSYCEEQNKRVEKEMMKRKMSHGG